mmetsp:Transcript_17361/g.31009  ORF Transcript_17361/g.31009 Transcript_17361/m.31009 type:complete len:249 (-) Transcript_17361:141-887(-)
MGIRGRKARGRCMRHNGGLLQGGDTRPQRRGAAGGWRERLGFPRRDGWVARRRWGCWRSWGWGKGGGGSGWLREASVACEVRRDLADVRDAVATGVHPHLADVAGNHSRAVIVDGAAPTVHHPILAAAGVPPYRVFGRFESPTTKQHVRVVRCVCQPHAIALSLAMQPLHLARDKALEYLIIGSKRRCGRFLQIANSGPPAHDQQLGGQTSELPAGAPAVLQRNRYMDAHPLKRWKIDATFAGLSSLL